MIFASRRTSVLAAAALAAAGTGATAQSFSKQRLLRGLDQPTGIAVEAGGDLYFTEVPQPGVMGGANEVSVRNGQTGNVSVVSGGEPEPFNLAVDPNGDVYWTCRTAGVIFRHSNGTSAPFLRGLDRPSGISAPGNGKLYITQVPTPGMPGSMGGRNTVDVVDIATGRITTISSGEPEPVDVVADASGNAYWTCRTAGVILGYDAATQSKSRILDGLSRPTGIAMDDAGRLYFTEVPSPGQAMTDNKVWQLEPDTAQLALVSIGEPEPFDVTAAPDGSTLYWTCRSAGVIFRADRTGTRPAVTSASSFGIGETVRFFLDAPGHGGGMYAAATSAGLGPIAVDSRFWALAPDGVFTATFARSGSPLVTGYLGLLDANGMGTAHLVIPGVPALQGLRLYTGFAVVDVTAPSGVAALSRTFTFEVR